jgi:hypothetical protein
MERRIRRARARAHRKLVRDQERLARLQPGGASERPIIIDSPARVEVIAGTMPCPLCAGTLRVDEHAATTVGGVRLRVARVVCTVCRVPRSVWFRLGESALH